MRRNVMQIEVESIVILPLLRPLWGITSNDFSIWKLLLENAQLNAPC